MKLYNEIYNHLLSFPTKYNKNGTTIIPFNDKLIASSTKLIYYKILKTIIIILKN